MNIESLDFESFVKLLDGNHACTFASVLYRAKETGEVARHTIMLNINRQRALKQDLAKLKELRPNLTLAILRQACDELIESITESIETGRNSRYTKPGYYSNASDKGNVQVSRKAVCYVKGYARSKRVIEPGVYKPDTRRPKTVAKDGLRAILKNTQYREFIITPELFKMARVHGRALIIDATGSTLSKLAGLAPVALSVPVTA